MMNRILIFCIFPIFVYSQSFGISDKSIITYYGYHFTKNWDGYSKDIDGTIFYNSNDKTVNSCSLKVNLSTFDSGNSNRDSNMLTTLEVFSYPYVEFVSNDISVKGENAFIKGRLTLHGVSIEKNIQAQISLSDGFIASGSFDVLLSDFGIERPSLLFQKIKDEIRIEFVIVGK